jgi:hypothetical protein
MKSKNSFLHNTHFSKEADMRKFLLIAAAAVAAVTGLAMINGCEGPAGPEGPMGKVVHDTVVVRDTSFVKDTMVVYDTTFFYDTMFSVDTVFSSDTVFNIDTLVNNDTIVKIDTIISRDTTLLSAVCGVCHGNGHGQQLAAKQYQWNPTSHSTGVTFKAVGGKSSCARCHSGNGFVTQTVKGKPKADIDTLNMTNINCRACHKIHTEYDTTDWDLSTVKKVSQTVKPADSIDIGKGNLCVNCHQAIAVNPVDTVTVDSIKVINRFGPHFGPQASILIGTGGCESICTTTVKPTDIPNCKANVPEGCVACHVNKVEGENHNFIATKRAVAAANSAINVDTIKAKVDPLLTEVRDSLVARNIIKIDTTAAIGVALVPPAAGTMFTKAVAGACWNYLLIKKDKSHGIHNSSYALWLLENSLAELKK